MLAVYNVVVWLYSFKFDGVVMLVVGRYAKSVGTRTPTLTWLVDNNHPLREFTSPSFREMIELANLAAAAALWVSHNSVSAFVMKLFSALQLSVVAAIEAASSKIHISFDGWTTKGSKRFHDCAR
jgi:hypothetical protein